MSASLPARLRVRKQPRRIASNTRQRSNHRDGDYQRNDPDESKHEETTVPWERLTHFRNGLIFVCSNKTYDECMELQLFGSPQEYIRNVQQLRVESSALFLFNVSTRRLHGVYKPTCRGKENIDRYAWTRGTRSRFTPFVAQIRFEAVHEFEALPETAFPHSIRGLLNGVKKLLSEQEVQQILDLYRQRVPPEPNHPALPRWRAVQAPNQQPPAMVPRTELSELQFKYVMAMQQIERCKQVNLKQEEKIQELMLQQRNAEEPGSDDEKKQCDLQTAMDCVEFASRHFAQNYSLSALEDLRANRPQDLLDKDSRLNARLRVHRVNVMALKQKLCAFAESIDAAESSIKGLLSTDEGDAANDSATQQEGVRI